VRVMGISISHFAFTEYIVFHFFAGRPKAVPDSAPFLSE
jgi:hypothetical protein